MGTLNLTFYKQKWANHREEEETLHETNIYTRNTRPSATPAISTKSTRTSNQKTSANSLKWKKTRSCQGSANTIASPVRNIFATINLCSRTKSQNSTKE